MNTLPVELVTEVNSYLVNSKYIYVLDQGLPGYPRYIFFKKNDLYHIAMISGHDHLHAFFRFKSKEDFQVYLTSKILIHTRKHFEKILEEETKNLAEDEEIPYIYSIDRFPYTQNITPIVNREDRSFDFFLMFDMEDYSLWGEKVKAVMAELESV